MYQLDSVSGCSVGLWAWSAACSHSGFQRFFVLDRKMYCGYSPWGMGLVTENGEYCGRDV